MEDKHELKMSLRRNSSECENWRTAILLELWNWALTAHCNREILKIGSAFAILSSFFLLQLIFKRWQASFKFNF